MAITRRALFRRGATHVVVSPLRVGSNLTLAPGTVIEPGTYRLHVIQSWYSRGLIGPVDTAWSNMKLARVAGETEQVPEPVEAGEPVVEDPPAVVEPEPKQEEPAATTDPEPDVPERPLAQVGEAPDEKPEDPEKLVMAATAAPKKAAKRPAKNGAKRSAKRSARKGSAGRR